MSIGIEWYVVGLVLVEGLGLLCGVVQWWVWGGDGDGDGVKSWGVGVRLMVCAVCLIIIQGRT